MNSQTEKLLIEYKPTEKRKTVNVAAVVAMSSGGLSVNDIAEEVEKSPGYIRKILNTYKFVQEKIVDFSQNEGIIQNGVKEKIVQALADGNIQIKTAKDAKDAALAYSIFYDKNRLQENKSTANVAVNINEISADVREKMQKFIKDLY